MPEKKDPHGPIHLSVPGAQHAPCGARTGVTSVTYDASFKRIINPNADAEMKELKSSASISTGIHNVTCLDCRKYIRSLYLAYTRGRRAKEIAW